MADQKKGSSSEPVNLGSNLLNGGPVVLFKFGTIQKIFNWALLAFLSGAMVWAFRIERLTTSIASSFASRTEISSMVDGKINTHLIQPHPGTVSEEDLRQLKINIATLQQGQQKLLGDVSYLRGLAERGQ